MNSKGCAETTIAFEAFMVSVSVALDDDLWTIPEGFNRVQDANLNDTIREDRPATMVSEKSVSVGLRDGIRK